jgi:hypothetical protein
MNLVICNSKKHCRKSVLCGGAKPHEPCTECDRCPMNKTAKCLPLKE